ncbi:MAG: hypothetical protein A3H97_23805 [Acidobacteria bacterium RIFCSPLOWO2_02_FULL_65_29]|nr:MAG: hypothetical protein A3H97_23805 [Acidobacteria bacterium RIFCSPLOWO2_02_FULL_65_29]
MSPFLTRLLNPVVDLRAGETPTALLMFAYSFLTIASYNILKPVSKSKFIESLGADNLPWVILGASVLIGVLMTGYARLMSALPRRWAIAIMQGVLGGALLALWFFFQTGQRWVPVAAYFMQLFMGVLLVSQFWTLANFVYDPRQAKRLFGFIGGGAPLGGVVASALVSGYTARIGTTNFLLLSAGFLAVCMIIVLVIVRRETPDAPPAGVAPVDAVDEQVGWATALQMLGRSKHLQIIAVIIGFAAVGGSIIDQQLSMAAQAAKGQTATDAITIFLGQVQLWMSAIAFVIQVWLTAKIHRLMGIGVALLVLPVSLGATGVVMLLNAALWAPALARIGDQSLRYTVDKTSREILFLPLPSNLKLKAKPLVDVTVDRFAKGTGAALALVLIKPWGLGWGVAGWQKLSYASLAITVAWIFMTIVARRGYLAAFRSSIERGDVQPAGLRLDVADLSTIEVLMEELASPDERRVLYAIEILESLEKHNLITPLLLYHESPAVRARALQALGAVKPEIAERWLPAIQRMISDSTSDVRVAALSALANIRSQQVGDLARPYLQDGDTRIASAVAVVLARSGLEADVAAADDVLSRLASDTRESTASTRKDVALAVRQIQDPRFRPLLIPLLHDSDPGVAAEAMRSVQAIGASDERFVPTLVSLLRHRSLKSSARDTLVGYGEGVLDALAYLLRDPDEDIWVRRHIPATIARIPSQKAVDILIVALRDADGFLRYKALAGLERLRRDHPELTFGREAIEARALKEGLLYFNCLTLHDNLFERAKLSKDALLADALQEKMARAGDRVYRLLGLVYPWKDIAAARYAIEHGDARARASGIEYVDNILSGPIRKRLMPLIDDLPLDQRVRQAHVALKTRPRDVEETLLQLINDDDQILAAAAIDLVEERKLWTLAGDIEFVLEHRDVKDLFVFEAASWALAAHRLPDNTRRSLWLEPLPVVQLAARLRRVPLFQSVPIDELFRIAGLGRQIRYESGRLIYQEGALPDQVHFLLDGGVTSTALGKDAREILPPALLGFEQVLDGSAMPETVRTTETTVCLALNPDELRSLISLNIALVEGLFHMLASRPRAADRGVIKRPATSEGARLPAGGLTPIQKVLMLQHVPTFAGISAEEMRHLAAIAQEKPLDEGATLFTESDAPALWAILSGRVTLASAAGEASAEAGDLVGVYETLAGSGIGRRGTVARAGRALRIERDELFDLMGQRPALLEQLFSALFRTPAQAAEERSVEVKS